MKIGVGMEAVIGVLEVVIGIVVGPIHLTQDPIIKDQLGGPVMLIFLGDQLQEVRVRGIPTKYFPDLLVAPHIERLRVYPVTERHLGWLELERLTPLADLRLGKRNTGPHMLKPG